MLLGGVIHKNVDPAKFAHRRLDEFFARFRAANITRLQQRATAEFPPTFLSAGNQDPLTRRQTPPMARRLTELGVPLEEFYPGDEAEPCFHEYQMRLGTTAGAEAFERVVAFLERTVARGPSNSH